MRTHLALTLIILTSLAIITEVQAVVNPQSILIDNYDDGSEMNLQIIKDYLSSEECLRRCRNFNEESLLNSFDGYRAEWV